MGQSDYSRSPSQLKGKTTKSESLGNVWFTVKVNSISGCKLTNRNQAREATQPKTNRRMDEFEQTGSMKKNQH